MGRGRLVTTVFVAITLLAVGLVSVGFDSVSGAAPPGAAAFVPLMPTRILDTRAGLGGQTLGDDSAIDVQVAGNGGVPATGAVAVALNLTATNATQPGFVTAWPTGGGRPVVSNLNVEHAGQTIANFAVVRLGASGKVSFYAFKQLDLVADVAGYWVQATTAPAGRYVAAGPARILDTRNGTGDFAVVLDTSHPASGPVGPVPDDGTVVLSVTGHGGVPAAGVSAVILNVTATEATQPGFVTVWPAGQGRPLASNLNVERAGQTIPNLVIVPVGGDGKVLLYAFKALHLVADVLGYFTDSTAPDSDQGLFVPGDPARILDTRALPQRGGLYTNTVVGGYRADLQVAGRAGVPAAGVGAVIANVTATNSTGPGFVTVYPAAAAQPLASNLNVDHVDQTIPNLVIGRLGYLGRVSMFSLTDIDLLFDVAGWFTGELTPPTPGVDLTPPTPPAPSIPPTAPPPVSLPPSPPTTPPPAGFGDGTHRVGTDIAAGRYQAPGSSDCYWARLKGFSGTVDDIIANDVGTTHVVVDIAPSDAGFEASGCGQFTPYTPPAAPVAAFGDGDWVVNSDIFPGTYQSPGSSGCYWARVTGFGGTIDEIVANDYSTGGPVTVTISPTDAGFVSSGCTGWTTM
jgi:hypothetical protein